MYWNPIRVLKEQEKREEKAKKLCLGKERYVDVLNCLRMNFPEDRVVINNVSNYYYKIHHEVISKAKREVKSIVGRILPEIKEILDTEEVIIDPKMEGEPGIIVYGCDEQKIEDVEVEICDPDSVITDWLYRDKLGNRYYAIIHPPV